MYKQLFIGNKVIKLQEVDSTNSHIQNLVNNNENEIEGLVVVAEKQYSGKGQRGNKWISEPGKNLTFSVLFKPNILAQNQFIISKVVSLSIVDFLINLGLNNVAIKWPNDIYINNHKIAGILIENSIKGNKIYNSIIGIGLNVNQTTFPKYLENAISIINIIEKESDLENSLNSLLFFLEKRYLMLKSNKIDEINNDYLTNLYMHNQVNHFIVNGAKVLGKIVGVSQLGKLQVEINKKIEEFDLKEIQFVNS